MVRGSGARRRTVMLALAGSAAAAAAVAAQAPEQTPELLARLEPGRWELRDPGDERALRAAFCLGDPWQLVQPQHGAAACERRVIASNARSLTVRYSCPSAGFGRTTIRYETPRLVRIDSQGVHRRVPFGFRAEARQVGPCGEAGTR